MNQKKTNISGSNLKALVTGASGFCGNYMTRYLESQDVEVHTVSYKNLNKAHHYHIKDITNVSELVKILEKVQPNYVLHLAGIAHTLNPSLYYRVNTQYAVTLLYALENAEMIDCPVLLVGTSSEYGLVSSEDVPIKEDFQQNPNNHYSISKLAQTFVGLAAIRKGQPVVIVRPFNIIGPDMSENLAVGNFAKQIKKIMRGDIPPVINVGNLETVRDFLDVNDIVRIYWQILKTPSAYGKIINVCSGKGVVMGELLSRLIDMSGLKIEVKVDSRYMRPIDSPIHYGSTVLLEKIIGCVPKFNLSHSLKRIIGE